MHVLEADIITNKKRLGFEASSSKDAFLLDMFQMTNIVLDSVINNYHTNGFHLFWDTMNKKCWLCGDWDERNNYLITESSNDYMEGDPLEIVQLTKI